MRFFKFIQIILWFFYTQQLHAGLEGILQSNKGGLDDYSGFIVYIKEGASLPKVKKARQLKVMGQVNKQFSPAVQGIQLGESVDFINYDDIFHNVFSLSPENKFDLGIFKDGKQYDENHHVKNENISSKVRFKKPGKVQVFCNIHEDMMGTVYVFDHGYFSQVKKNGQFSLPYPSIEKITLVIDGDRINRPIEKVIRLKEGKRRFKIGFSAIDQKRVPKHLNKNGEKYEGSWSIEEDEFY